MSHQLSRNSRRNSRLRFDYDALLHNFNRVKHYAPRSRIMAVIKANAYGHDAVKVAQTLKEADAFALAFTSEAIKLRSAGIEQPLVVLQGFDNLGTLEQMLEHKIQPVIHHQHQLEQLANWKGRGLKLWLKLDSGMHRFGLSPDEFIAAFEQLSEHRSVESISLMSHFANADDPAHELNQAQLHSFISACQPITGELSMANSAGIVAIPESHFNWVRPGIMLYGSSPMLNQSAHELDLKPVMHFTSTVSSIKQLKKGDTIGYGSTWVCPENMPVALIAAGYADGYPRHAGSGTPVLVNGQRTGLLGRVSMDSLCIDLRNIDASIDDEVTLWGDGLSVDEVAVASGTIGYELLCNAGNAARLVYN